jgi:cation transport ATPase
MGTSVAAGTGQAVVVATAMNTELGRIAGLIEEAGAEEGTPLQQKLDSLGCLIVWAALGIVALFFGLGLLRGTKLFEKIPKRFSQPFHRARKILRRKHSEFPTVSTAAATSRLISFASCKEGQDSR